MDYNQTNGQDRTSDDAVTAQLLNFVDLVESVPKTFSDLQKRQSDQLETYRLVLETMDKQRPGIVERIKQLELSIDLMSGKHKSETLQVLLNRPTPTQTLNRDEPEEEAPKEKRIMVKRKSETITDEVVARIRDFIAADEEYHKGKDIYKYLLTTGIISEADFPKGEHQFGIQLARVDQDQVKYFGKYNIQAWGLADFGTPEHLRRKALKRAEQNRLQPEAGTRVTSYGKIAEPAM